MRPGPCLLLCLSGEARAVEIASQKTSIDSGNCDMADAGRLMRAR